MTYIVGCVSVYIVKPNRSFAVWTGAFVALVLLSLSASAATYVFNFDNSFAKNELGTTNYPASPNTPWIVATVEDLATGGVRLSVTNINLMGAEKVYQLMFNLNPVLDPAQLTFSFVGSSGGFELPTVTSGFDYIKADGDGKYDVLLQFSQAPQKSFTAGEWLQYDITSIVGLQASDFWFLSTPAGGQGIFYAAAHVQSIGPESLSAWIGVPVPEPHFLSVAGLGLCILLTRKFSGCRS